MIRESERAGRAMEVPEGELRHRRPGDATRSGSSPDPNPETRIQSTKRMEIRVIQGRLQVVEIE